MVYSRLNYIHITDSPSELSAHLDFQFFLKEKMLIGTHFPLYMMLLSLLLILSFMSYLFFKHISSHSFKFVFKDLKRKLCMTFGLGIVFFGFYASMVWLSSRWIEPWKSDVFLLMYRYPKEFIYLGLGLFALCSLFIYLLRMVIKYVYLTRGKDS